MNSITKSPERRLESRRTGERRKTDLPITGSDRRVADRRAGSDRRG
nr:hypothetical protein [Altererythrobacter segetis]